MKEIQFKWTSNELLTKKRMDEFTDYLHQRFGLLNSLHKGDYGFGLTRGQKIQHEQTNNEIRVSLPIMNVVFPDGFLISFYEQIELANEYEKGILCLGISGDRTISLNYCQSESEALDNNYLPLLNTSQASYLTPVLQITNADDYDLVRKSLNQSLESCLDLINKYFLSSSSYKNTFSSILRRIVFQAYLTTIQKINFHLVTYDKLGSYSYFNVFKNLFLLTDSFKEYFDKIDELHGIQNKYSRRDSSFIDVLTTLKQNLNLLHTNDYINIFDQWMKDLCNLIKVYTMLSETGDENVLESNIASNSLSGQKSDLDKKNESEKSPQRSIKLK